ncbi:MAG: DNA polymerase/3'-5' exonuclease PolX [Candidatus Latescibacteria bacterium]|nr:DNA polymerase/3'-5' exonuclease PolX [Candidatus Latescibacterota bacterium]
MDVRHVREILEEIGVLLDLKGENPFKSRAYLQASRTVQGLGEELTSLVERGMLPAVKGIGPGLASVIVELVRTGRSSYYEEVRGSVPSGLLEMLSVPGLGPKKVRAIYEHLQITTVGELEYACLENRLVTLEGFGVKSQEKILEGIAALKRYRGRYLYSEAVVEGTWMADDLMRMVSGCRRVVVAGSLRRCMETVRNINLVAEVDDPQGAIEAFLRMPGVEEVVSKEGQKAWARLSSGMEVSLVTTSVTDGVFGYLLYRYTGSERHLEAMTRRAAELGIRMDEEGMCDEGGTLLTCQDEKEFFEHLHLPFLPPEIREGNGEVEAAERGELPRLVRQEDIRGILHVHSTDSDGDQSIEELARAVRAAGYAYLGICDHSRSAAYAGGLSIERVEEQRERIDRLNAGVSPFRVLKGIEVDILPDGRLDYDDDVLASFDVVVASVHSRFTMSRDEMTDRIVRAIRNPYVSILGHPTGRLLLAREGYQVDVDRILDEAARTGTVVELNANPRRLDLDWRYLRKAKALGIKIAIDPDAHRVDGLWDITYGVGIARKGWLEVGDVINTMRVEEVLTFFREQRKRQEE